MDFGRHLFALQFADGFLQQPHVHIETDGVDVAVLLATQQISRAAQFQVERRNLEPGAQVAELLQRRQAFARHFAQFGIRRYQQIGISAAVGATHAPAQLVKLRQAITLGIFDDDGVGEGDIETVFYNCRANEDVVFVAHELEHGFFQFGFAHLAMSHADAGVGNELLQEGRARPNGIHAVVQEIDLPAAA